MMHSEVATVTEDDGVRILAFAVVADGAFAFVKRQNLLLFRNALVLRVGKRTQSQVQLGARGVTTDQVEPLLLKLVEQDFKHVV